MRKISADFKSTAYTSSATRAYKHYTYIIKKKNPQEGLSGAGDGGRTRDLLLGKETLYH